MNTMWESIVTHLEIVALWVSIVAAVAGFVATNLIWWRWSWIEPWYQEHWTKIAVAFFRAVAAFSALASKSIPLDPQKAPWDQPWVVTILIAVLGYLFWELAAACGDVKLKRAKEKMAEEHKKEIGELKQRVSQASQDREDAEFEATRNGWLLTALRELVGFKRQRIRVAATDARASIGQARMGLGPNEQVRILLEGIANLLRLQAVAEDRTRHNQNFRIGLVAEKDGRLMPLAAFDLASKSHEPFSSYANHAERYKLDNAKNPSLAVRCIQEGHALIVADAEAEPGFYIHDLQRRYLRSMIACPLERFCADGITPTQAALLIDTDVVGFFHEDNREMLELLLKEFVVRIDLEYAISGLIG
jgi:hypothetical protein